MPLSKLNTQQFQAATAPLGHNLIIASAGTGKTSTIVARISHLLLANVKPENILLLTFTNKAASEMIDRLQRFFDKNVVEKIEAGTFHAVSYRVLKKLEKNVVLKQPSELKILLKSILAKRRFDHIDSQSKPYSASYLYDLFSLYQNSSPNKYFGDWIDENYSEHSLYADIYEDVLMEFRDEKKKFGYVDFNDLLIQTRDAILRGAKIYFDEILIDEYQDTNPLQESLVDAFGAGSLFCVGDYDQSIYAFNGADISIIGGFSQKYKNANVFSLNKNYRSSSPILSLANRVIQNNPRLYPKSLEVTRTLPDNPPVLLIYNELFDQYKDIAQKIKESIVAHDQIAVIFRNNSSADGIEANLREAGIACKRKGSSSFFDSKEIKAILDLMSLVVQPKDMMAFIHIFEYAKGVGASLSKEFFDILFELGEGNVLKGFFDPKENINPFKKEKRTNYQLGLFEDDFEYGSVSRFYSLGFSQEFLSHAILKHPKINQDGAVFLYAFFKYLKSSRRIKNPLSLIDQIVDSEIYISIISLLARKRATQKDGTVNERAYEEAKDRIKRKTVLLRELAKSYHDSERFLNALTLGSGEMSEGNGVNLLSVHASKGLEFHTVFLVDLMEGRFPNHKLMSMGGSIEEERRLFYVATTRAKDILYLSYSTYDKIKKNSYIPSIFLKEANLIG